jgi:SWIM zinc finger
MTLDTTIRPNPLRSTVHIKKLQEASRHLMVIPRDPERGRYLVESAHDPGRAYEVALQRGDLTGHCTCPWAQYGGINCKHVLAALREHYAPWGALSFWPSRDAAQRQHRRILPGERLYATLRPRGRRRH